jgi:DNA-binding response OmpR family regulator
VVDDDPAVHRIVSALFAADGHVVDAARSADDALAMAAAETYDLVLADARAVTAGGLFFADALLGTRPGWASRVVIANGNGRTESGAAHQVSKPFNLRELRALADELFSNPPRSPAAMGGY